MYAKKFDSFRSCHSWSAWQWENVQKSVVILDFGFYFMSFLLLVKLRNLMYNKVLHWNFKYTITKSNKNFALWPTQFHDHNCLLKFCFITTIGEGKRKHFRFQWTWTISSINEMQPWKAAHKNILASKHFGGEEWQMNRDVYSGLLYIDFNISGHKHTQGERERVLQVLAPCCLFHIYLQMWCEYHACWCSLPFESKIDTKT